jgi:alkanesulfonate monooxygenase SsuD/methylene tetrahydromethanopterin reductase-like flavin-dependent oxidoreductase (luciferase family)
MMELGLGLLGYDGSWDDAAFAEEHGFATAGFVDSPLLGGDPFVCMARAALLTSRIRLGSFLAVPSNRNAATTVTATASVSRIAPLRTFLALGTGYSSRNTFGMPPLPARRLRAYASDCRDLLNGAEISYTEGASTKPVRLLHVGDRYLGPTHEIPVMVAGDGPMALEAVGATADGWVTTLQRAGIMFNAREVFRASLATVREAARQAGRSFEDKPVMWSAGVCVLQPGERPTSARVLARVGPYAMMPFHSYADNPAIADRLPAVLAERIPVYEREVLARFDRARLHQEVHRGHLSHLLEGEAEVLTDDVIRATCLVGEAHEVADVLHGLEEEGLTNLSLWIPPALTRDGVLEIAGQVAPRL